MYKIFLLSVLFVATSLIGAEVNWAKDYETGIKEAAKTNKPVMFIISRDTCKYCVLLDDTTLKDEKVVKKLNSEFISIRSWTNEGDFIPPLLRQNTPGLPGIWFLYPNGDPMYQPLLGYVKKDNFYDALDVVSTEFAKITKKGTK
jgi:thioredoxin-related protein